MERNGTNGFLRKEKIKLSQFQYFVDVKYNFKTKNRKDNNDEHIKQEQWYINNGSIPLYLILRHLKVKHRSHLQK